MEASCFHFLVVKKLGMSKVRVAVATAVAVRAGAATAATRAAVAYA